MKALDDENHLGTLVHQYVSVLRFVKIAYFCKYFNWIQSTQALYTKALFFIIKVSYTLQVKKTSEMFSMHFAPSGLNLFLIWPDRMPFSL